ncbi:MAG TPA: hypothetical protein VGQ64_02025 [Candidatus Limnocylindrales bacterium]|nr:hypothetical protein [Candidatus Limnocylindrales bacterium]
MAADGMLHPIVGVAIVLLIVNDHLLKRLAPGFVTGKLSDVAGLVFFPLLLVAATEVVGSLSGRWRRPSPRAVTLAIVGTGLVFAAVKTSPIGESIYEAVLGAIQWPFAAVVSAALGGTTALPREVELTRDATDLVALAALWVPYEIGMRRAATRPAAARIRLYDLAVAGTSLALLFGAILDGWAHSHERLALESIVTPWHAVVYTAYAATVALLMAPMARAAIVGDRPRLAIPPGFGASVLGVVVFVLFGLADVAWHAVFGIEADAEALISPTHLGLALGAILIASGPVRSAWLRDGAATWPSFLPVILSLTAIAGIVQFALHVANLFVDPWPRFPYERYDPTWYGPNIGVAAAMLQTTIVMIPALLLIARWRTLPAGTMTVLIGGSTVGLTFLHDGHVLVGAPVLAGFLADVLLIGLRPGDGPWRLQAFAFLAPAMLFGAYFAVLATTGPVAWSAHLIGGTLLLAGATGWSLSIVQSAGSSSSTMRGGLDGNGSATAVN